MAAAQVAFNPFPGLRPFEPDEAHLYFGRDGQCDELLRWLKRTRFLAVVGTSGSGKSSLVRAGLLPALRGGVMASVGSDWRIAVLRPGNDPIGNLARALTGPGAFGAADPARAEMQAAIAETLLRRSSLGLLEVVRQARVSFDEDGQPRFPAHEKLLVVVDQFEEVFHFKQRAETARARADAAAFVELLLEATRAKEKVIFEEQVYIILTMRSDYLGDCAQFWDLPEAINNGQYLIPRMTRAERRAAITGPAGVGHARIAELLVNQLLNDAGDNPDHLPILQHALMRTWEHWARHRRDGEEIAVEHYHEIGGLDGALSQHADEAFKALDPAQQKIAEKLFKALTEKIGDRESRRPRTLQEICEVISEEPGQAVDPQQVIPVIEAFRAPGRSFLTPKAGEPLRDDTLIDISHESLIRGWKQLQQWVNEEALSARIYRRLAETAALYQTGGTGLLRDPELQLALNWHKNNHPNAAWAKRYHPGYDEARAFLERSERERAQQAADQEREQQERAEMKRRKLEAEKAYAEERQRTAEYERRQAEDRQRLAEFERQQAEDNQRLAELELQRAEEQAALRQREFIAERQRAEERTRTARRLYWLTVALTISLVLALGTAVYALAQNAEAERLRTEAEAQKAEAVRAKKQAEKLQGEAEERARHEKDQATLLEKQIGLTQQALADAEMQRQLADARAAEARRLQQQSARQSLLGQKLEEAIDLSLNSRDQEETIRKFGEVLTIQEQLGEGARRVNTLIIIGDTYKNAMDEAEPARTYYGFALPFLQEDRSRARQAAVHIKIAETYDPAKRADRAAAEQSYSQAAVIYRALGDVLNEATTLISLGQLYLGSSDSEEKQKTDEYFSLAAAAAKRASDPSKTITTLEDIAARYEQSKDKEHRQKAAEYYRDTVPFYHQLKTPAPAADNLAKAASLMSESKDKERTMPLYRAAALHYQRAGMRKEVAEIWMDAGKFLRELKERGEAAEAFNQAAQVYREMGERNQEAATLILIGRMYDQAESGEEKRKAKEYFDRVPPIYQAANDRKGEADVRLQIAQIYLASAELDVPREAEAYFNQAVQLYSLPAERAEQVALLVKIGGLYVRSPSDDRRRKAEEYYNRAWRLHHDAGDSIAATVLLLQIGETYLALTDPEQQRKAEEYFEQAIQLHSPPADYATQAATLVKIGGIYGRSTNQTRQQKAAESYLRALKLYTDAGDRTAATNLLLQIGEIYLALTGPVQQRKAEEYFDQAIQLHSLPADHATQAATLVRIGGIYRTSTNQATRLQKAAEYYQRALALYRAAGDHTHDAALLKEIASLYRGQQKWQEAINYYSEALPLFRQAHDFAGEGDALVGIGLGYIGLKRNEEGQAHYRQAIAAFQKALPALQAPEERSKKASLLYTLGGVHSSLGEKQQALESYQQALPLLEAMKDARVTTTRSRISALKRELGN